MAFQTLTSPTDASFPTGKRSHSRKRPRDFDEEEYLESCLLKLARGTSEILKPSPSFALNYLQQEKTVSTKTTVDVKKDEEKVVLDEKKDEEKSALTTTMEVKKDQEPSVHICNVCNKSFTCHQALGGHKASHRLVKIKILGLKKTEESSEAHECGTCHKKFSSGQALGGHKRMHYEGVICAAKKRSSGGSTEGGASVGTERVVNDFDLNVALISEDSTLYCDEESAFM